MEQTVKTLAQRSTAAVTLGLRWAADGVQHEDLLHFERFSVWRDADALPASWQDRLPGMYPGDMLATAHAAGELVPATSAADVLILPTQAFDRHYLPGREVRPAFGRFYPRGFFHGHHGLLPGEWAPARVIALDTERISIDLNHPLAGRPLEISLGLEAVHEETDQRGGRCNNCIADLLRHPGMKADRVGESATDYWAEGALSRPDAQPDSAFYAIPRLVQHLDALALRRIAALYARLISPGARVLDLMGSWDSHLAAVQTKRLDVLGLNLHELAANRQADATHVHDLNARPQLPFADGNFDCVVCTASAEYLIRPAEVFAEARRVLRPGGVFITSFSNRWFPTKAVRVWSELHEFERPGLITALYRGAGFTGLNTYSARGWPRPANDPHTHQTHLSDPVHAVWGVRPDG